MILAIRLSFGEVWLVSQFKIVVSSTLSLFATAFWNSFRSSLFFLRWSVSQSPLLTRIGWGKGLLAGQLDMAKSQ